MPKWEVSTRIVARVCGAFQAILRAELPFDVNENHLTDSASHRPIELSHIASAPGSEVRAPCARAVRGTVIAITLNPRSGTHAAPRFRHRAPQWGLLPLGY
jgi:hypothetical protein